MSAYTNTAPAAKKAIVNLLTAALADPTKPLEVHRNRPVEAHQKEENVYVTDILKGGKDWAGVGRQPPRIEENYHVAIEIEVLRRGNDGDAAEDRCWEIVATIEDILIQHYTLDGLDKIVHVHIDGFEQTSSAGNDGWDCSAVLEVAVKARL